MPQHQVLLQGGIFHFGVLKIDKNHNEQDSTNSFQTKKEIKT